MDFLITYLRGNSIVRRFGLLKKLINSKNIKKRNKKFNENNEKKLLVKYFNGNLKSKLY